MTKKEFEMQRALGLADEFILQITIKEPFKLNSQAIKDAVDKHTFDSICVYTKWDDSPNIPIHWLLLEFNVKCVPEIDKLLFKELPQLHMEIKTLPKQRRHYGFHSISGYKYRIVS